MWIELMNILLSIVNNSMLFDRFSQFLNGSENVFLSIKSSISHFQKICLLFFYYIKLVSGYG